MQIYGLDTLPQKPNAIVLHQRHGKPLAEQNLTFFTQAVFVANQQETVII